MRKNSPARVLRWRWRLCLIRAAQLTLPLASTSGAPASAPDAAGGMPGRLLRPSYTALQHPLRPSLGPPACRHVALEWGLRAGAEGGAIQPLLTTCHTFRLTSPRSTCKSCASASYRQGRDGTVEWALRAAYGGGGSAHFAAAGFRSGALSSRTAAPDGGWLRYASCRRAWRALKQQAARTAHRSPHAAPWADTASVFAGVAV